MTTRSGKIARLPHAIRDQLNARLHDGEPAGTLLPWLNGLPAVQTILTDHFEGRPVTEQNLSVWRLGGFADWLRLQELCGWLQHLREEAAGLQQAAGGASAAATLTPIVAVAVGRCLEQMGSAALGDPAQAQALLALTRELARLRRCDLAEDRLRLDRERWAAEQAAAREKAEKDRLQAEEDRARAARAAAVKARLFPNSHLNYINGYGPMPGTATESSAAPSPGPSAVPSTTASAPPATAPYTVPPAIAAAIAEWASTAEPSPVSPPAVAPLSV